MRTDHLKHHRFFRDYGVITAILITAVLLRVYKLSAFALWLDETDTLYAAIQKIYVYPPLFFILLTAWQPVAVTDFMLRLLPALIGVAGVFTTWKLARDITEKSIANTAALFIAAAPLAVYYAQELRMYGLLLALSAWSWQRFFRLMRSTSRGNMFLFALSVSLCIYTHHYAFFFLAGQFLAVFTFKPVIPRLNRVIQAFSLAAVSYLPYMASFWFLFSRFSNAKFWSPPITLDTLKYTVRILTASYESGSRAYIALSLLIVLTGAVSCFVRRFHLVFRLWLFGFIAPIGLAMGVSMLLPTSMYVPRYVLFVLPPMLIASGAGIHVIGNRLIYRQTLIAAVIMLQSIGLTGHYTNVFARHDIAETRPRKQFREPAMVIADRFQPGDALGTTCLSGSGPLWYYLHYRRQLPMSIQLDIDGSYARHLEQKYNMNDFIDAHYPFFKPVDVQTVAANHRRLWLYATQWNLEVIPEDFYLKHRIRITEWFTSRYPVILHRPYYGVELYLFDLEHPISGDRSAPDPPGYTAWAEKNDTGLQPENGHP